MADEVAAYLAGVRTRTRQAVIGVSEARGAVPRDAVRLLAAVEAVLAQHQPGRIVVLGAVCSRHEAHRHFSITSTEAADVMACPDCSAAVYVSCTGCGTQMRLDSCPARTAISAALLREGESGG